MSRLTPRSLLLAALLIATAAAPALSDGFIVVEPRRPSRPQIRNVPLAVKYHHVDVTIRDQVAVTEIDQVFVNPNGWVLEGTYIFPLPDGASISKFSMFIDGKEVKAELLERDKAREIYEGIVRRMEDPALLEYVGRRMFQARIFPIPAHGEKRLKLSYSQVLKSSAGLVEYLYPLNTEKFSSKPLESCAVNVTISGGRAIQNVYSPTHPVEVVKKSDKTIRASYEAKGVKPDTDFRLYYSQDAKDFALNLVTHKPKGEDGYYMLLLSPGDTGGPVIAKDVVFVQDTSGSMQDDGKLDQARKALRFCLKALRKGDRFGLVSFATEPRSFRESLIDVNDDNVGAALEHVAKLEAIGGTNIQGALEAALSMAGDAKRPFMIVFFTDGRPTIGERDLERLAKGVDAKAAKNVRLFTFGVGNDVNAPLLDRLAADNRGTTEYVAPKEDLEVKVGSFFTKIASPVLADTKVGIEGITASDVYPKALPDLFKGSQLVVLGRFTGDAGGKVIRLTGLINGEKKEIVHEVKIATEDDNDFLPRLWAIRKVGYLLRQMRTHGETSEVKHEIVRLAKRHGIVTPYTSFLVLEDERMLDREGGPRPETASAPRDAFRGGRARTPSPGGSGGGGKPAGDAPFERGDLGGAEEDPADDGGLREKTGADAVKASKEIDRLMRDGKLESKGKDLDRVLKHVGSKTFYFDTESKTWFDAEVKADAKRTKVKLFSTEYFDLIKKHEELAKYLALGKKVVVELDGTVFEIIE